MITLRSSVAAAGALGMLALSTLARAQPAAAEAAFNQGLADMQAGRYDTGCPALAESQRLDPRPGTLFTLAECEAKRGRIGTALAYYREYLALYDAMKPEQKSRQSERAKIATKQRAALEGQVPTLALVLPPDAPPGLSIKRDGTVMEASAFGEAIPLDPGEHVVTTQAPGAPVTERRVTLSPGDHKQILIDAKGAMEAPRTVAPPPPPVLPVAPPPDRGPSGQRVAAYVVGGLGVFGLVLGGVAGGLTLGKKGVIKDNCNLGGDETLCNHEGKLAADSAKTTGLISTVGFAVGGAGVVTAVVLLVTAPRKKPVAAGATRVRGDVLAVGREGTVLGIHGAW